MKLTEAKEILKRNGYRVLTESEGEAQVYLYLSKPDGRKDKIWFMYSGSEASSIELNLNIDYFKELLSKLGVSNKFFNLLDDLDWGCIKETYEYEGEGDLYSFGEAHSDCWDNGAYGGNNNPNFDWGGELTANLYSDNEDAVVYFLRNITAEALVALFNNSTDIFSMYDYIDNGNIEDAFTDEEYGEKYKKYIDEFGVTIDEVVDFVNAMSNDKLIQTLAKDIKETPDFRERL